MVVVNALQSFGVRQKKTLHKPIKAHCLAALRFLLEKIILSSLCLNFIPVKYISNVVTTVLAFKEDPKCNALCCLEILQLVTDAPGEVNNTSAPSPESQDLFQNVANAENEEHLDNEKQVPIKDGSKKNFDS